MKRINQHLPRNVFSTLVLSAILTACGGDSPPADDVSPPTPTLQVSNIQIVEGDSEFATATVNITLSVSSDKTVSVNYETEDGSAVAPGDYTSSDGTVTFPAGETSQSFTVEIVSDMESELDESFNIKFSNPQNATLATETIAVLIENDDVVVTLPVLQIDNNVSVTEGDSGITTAVFDITRSGSSAGISTVDYATGDMTATVASSDYQSKSGSLTFSPGETSKTVTVNVVADTEVEFNETFNLTLSNPGNASLNNAVGTATITNDDIVTLPVLQIDNNVSVTEGSGGGTTAAVFSITLSGSRTGDVIVEYATSDTTATAGEDYESKNGSLIFGPTESSKTVTVNVVADDLAEINETFELILSNPVNADLSGAIGVATIIDDDIDSTILLSNPGPKSFDEEQAYTIDVIAKASARVFVSGMPPGMHWDEVNRRFDFRPDFIQGGKSWTITMEAVDGVETAIETFTVTINNNIQPPWPKFVSQKDKSGLTNATGVTIYSVTQTTDDFLDSRGHAGRSFEANLTVPKQSSATNPMAVGIGLHASGGKPGTVGEHGLFGIAPDDPVDNWWSGYNDQMPLEPGETIESVGGTIPNYTQRRVMHLLSYLLNGCPGLVTEGVNACPGADPERISVFGQSMGGTGSLFLAINYARHFAEIGSRVGGTTPHFLSPGHQTQLTSFWGEKGSGLPTDRGINVWHQYDASRAVRNNKDFRNLHFRTISGKNDSTISFHAMVGLSPVTGRSFFTLLQDEKIGHFNVWDQRDHGTNEPGLSNVWWSQMGPLHETISFLSRNLAFPAFSKSSIDDDAGEPDGLGGYTGALRGARNRYLRWDSANIIDTRSQLIMPIKVDIDTTGDTPPAAGYPALKNEYYGPLPITAHVTIRRIQQFQVLPGEEIHWRYGEGDESQTGTVYANADGSVTVSGDLKTAPGLEMATSFTPLVLTRP